MEQKIEKIINSLLSNNFLRYENNFFICHEKDITVKIGSELDIDIYAHEVYEQDVKDYIEEFLNLDRDIYFAEDLIEWIEMKRQEDEECPGFTDNDEELGHLDVEYLKNIVEYDNERELIIYTWGNKLMKSKHKDSQKNFNACILNGRGGGIDLRTMNGLSDEIQRVISRCNRFDDWMSMCIRHIEENDLNCISINCTKGRHRSVAAAEILKKIYYPNSTIYHLTIR